MKPANLLRVCFSDRTASKAREELIAKNLVWEDLFRAAEDELMIPALHARFQELGVLTEIPADAKSFLAAVENLNLERNQQILSELAVVAYLLNQVGIEPVLLKGSAYFLTGVYPSPAGRYLWDVDLLIPKLQLQTAVDVLSRNGFEQGSDDRLAEFRHHHPPLRRKGSIFFELHHSLGMGLCSSLLPASEVIEHSTEFDFQGTRVRLPSPTHLMTHLIMHSQIQHPYNERIWPPLRAMRDLLLLRRRFDNEIDWSFIQHQFRKVGRPGVLAMHLLQVRDTLGSETPFAIRLTGLTYLRWLRRKLLRALPPLRFLDPVYMYSTVLVRRLRVLRNALGTPGGRRRIASEIFAPGVYRRIATDILEGQGR
jgi:hypothetical protein